MMKKQSLLIGILIAILLTACTPTSSATNPPAAATDPATATLVAPTLEAATQPATSEEQTVVPLATSRGPELHATDPMSVSMASGGLQFVEFFRFT